MKAEMKLSELVIAGIIVVAALAVIGYFWIMPALGVTQQSSSAINVYATGVSYAQPTQATVSLTVNGTGNTTQLATENLSKTLNTLNATLAGYINNNWTMVSTQSYNVNKVYNKSIYMATESMSVTLPNISNSSAFLGSMSAIPNVYVNGIQSMLSDWQVNMLRNSALQNALSNATSQARTLAGNGTSVTVGNITVNGYNVYPYAASGANGFISAASAAISNPAFYSGRSKVVEAITVSFKYWS